MFAQDLGVGVHGETCMVVFMSYDLSENAGFYVHSPMAFYVLTTISHPLLYCAKIRCIHQRATYFPMRFIGDKATHMISHT